MFMAKLVLYLENDIVTHKLDEGEKKWLQQRKKKKRTQWRS